jgi:septum formation protein
MKQIVLASASPRRRELFKLLGIEFISISTQADETPRPGEGAAEMVERLSRLKARQAQAEYADAVVIAADTDVELDGTILGKPQDPAGARAMLSALRNRAHSVFTGLTLGENGRAETELVHSRVFMRNYTDAEMERYVASGDPLDKAAGYAVQHQGFQPVARVDGCFANVMGLPVCRLYHALARRTDLPAPQLDCIAHPERDCTVERMVIAPTS